MTLAIEQLSVRIGGRRILDDVTVAPLPGGTLVGLIGPNGAGKSTLARALLGLQRAGAGRVMLDGCDVAAMPRAAAARTMAYLPQGQALHWPLSVERLVALGRLPHLPPLGAPGAADREAIERAMTRCDVAGLATRDATSLSGGERARAMLARALAVEAPVLVADEPLAALDPSHQFAVMRLLRAEAARGALVIAVLHDLALAARFCDRLLVLDAGRLVSDGVPAGVLTSGLLYSVFAIDAAIGWRDGIATLNVAPDR